MSLIFSVCADVENIVIGRGSNCLVDDRGFDGLVRSSAFHHWSVMPHHIRYALSGSMVLSRAASNRRSLGTRPQVILNAIEHVRPISSDGVFSIGAGTALPDAAAREATQPQTTLIPRPPRSSIVNTVGSEDL